uniref:Putative Psc4 n=1 Tax=Reticulitermes speratus TaxID=60591 RepID=A0A2Z5U1Y5_9NEOP
MAPIISRVNSAACPAVVLAAVILWRRFCVETVLPQVGTEYHVMATIQTKIKFNVRKKRLNSSKLNNGKENANYGNKVSSATSVCVDHGRKFYESKCQSQYGDILLRPYLLSDDSSDSDSDIECLVIKQCENKSGVRKGQCTKSLHTENADDKSTDEVENTSSPPKRSKTVTDDCTPPHTPSHLMTQLYLSTPCDSAVTCTEKQLPPKQLFASCSTYQEVRQALQGCASTSLPGREEHLDKLRSFLQDHLTAGTSGTLYVSGPPGTGKTACLSKVMELPEFTSGYKIVSLNCTSMKSSSTVYARIAQELTLKVSKQTEKSYLASIERYLASDHKMILLVLDEIDQLDSRKQSVLYTIFEWPSAPDSKLVLIGIANALDLTDRILPRLQARLDLRPRLLHFAPYTKLEIVNILTERLKQCDVSAVFPSVALELLAGKVASTCGDIRRALDIGRRVIELAEAQKLNQIMPLQPTVDHAANTSSPRKSPRKNPDTGSVALKQVITVLNSVYGTSQSLVADSDEHFPLQQKVLVSALLLILKKGHSKDVTVGKLHEVYCRICKKKNILAVDQAEFLSLCQLVEARGILKVQGRKEARLSRVCLQWDEEEVSAALKDKQLLASILNDTMCLP